MWTSALLKTEAKGHLRSYYWTAFAVCLVYGIISGLFSGSSSSGGAASSTDAGGGSLFYDLTNPEFAVFTTVFLVVFFVLMVISVAGSAFLVSPAEVGMNRFFMESRVGASRFERLFFAFQHGGKDYLNIVKIMFLRNLKIFLWTLLLIVPGIVKGYEYRMVAYILSERPDLPMARVFELSREMTRGEKMNIFVLDLSFIGWWVLGFLACCIGTLFVSPYYYATCAELYTALREKAFGTGISNSQELTGFQA